jgi:internalin A
VLLVTPDFLASDFINDHELPFLLKAAKEREVSLIWIYVKHSLVEETPIIELQCAHEYNRPLTSLTPHELSECLVEIAREIKKACEAR